MFGVGTSKNAMRAATTRSRCTVSNPLREESLPFCPLTDRLTACLSIARNRDAAAARCNSRTGRPSSVSAARSSDARHEWPENHHPESDRRVQLKKSRLSGTRESASVYVDSARGRAAAAAKGEDETKGTMEIFIGNPLREATHVLGSAALQTPQPI